MCIYADLHTQVPLHTHTHLPAPDTGFITTHNLTPPSTEKSTIYMCLYKSYTLPIITKCMSPTSVHVQAHPNTHILSDPHTQMPPGTPFTTLDILRPLPTYKLTRMCTQTHTHICTHTLTYRHHIHNYLLTDTPFIITNRVCAVTQ